MDVRVVCISRTMAAGGETVGELVAQRLGFRYVDEQIITLAARPRDQHRGAHRRAGRRSRRRCRERRLKAVGRAAETSP